MKLPYENWLKEIAEHLHGRGLSCVLGYDDRRLGNLIALAVTSKSELCEVDVHRTDTGAVLVLTGESRLALQVLADALGPFHESIPRLKNAKRKFSHRIERMLQHLVETFDERARDFPQEAFGKLREPHPEAAPMIGIEALFREKQHEQFRGGIGAWRAVATVVPLTSVRDGGVSLAHGVCARLSAPARAIRDADGGEQLSSPGRDAVLGDLSCELYPLLL